MKKQILILSMLTLAIILAGNIKSFGQVNYIKHVEGTPACAPSIPLGCATTQGELNPAPGVVYTYEISTDPTTVESVLWFVTDVSQVITAAGGITTTRDPGDGSGAYVLLGEVGVYNVPTQTDKTIDISWQYFDGVANEVLLVAYVKGATGCSDNVEVWRIEPTFAFTLDLLSMASDGSLGTIANPAFECVSPVESATYNGTTMAMDYGENWVFFSVNAANFTNSWMPDFTGTAITGTSTIASITWAYPNDAQADAGPWHATTDPVQASAAAVGGVVGTAGECIVVRVEIQHANNPTPLAANTETVTLNVNGVMYDAANNNYTNTALNDVDEVSGNCVQNVTDTGNYILRARPQVTAINPIPFVPKN